MPTRRLCLAVAALVLGLASSAAAFGGNGFKLYAAADQIRAGFSNLHATVEISSPADIYEIERLRVTVERHAPVLDIVRNPTPVKIELVLTQAKSAAPIAA